MRKRFYNPYFTPMQYSPALWLDASDQSTLIMDGARTFASASSQKLTVADDPSLRTGNVDFWIAFWFYPNAATGYGFLNKSDWSGSSEFWAKLYYDGAAYRLYFGTHVGGTASRCNLLSNFYYS